jgi:hypothetical protein
MASKNRIRVTIFIFLFMIIGCNGGQMADDKITFKKIADVSDAAWQKLAMKKIYFGHQSVGNNILNGVKDLIELYPQIHLNIVETSDPGDFNSGLFAHSKVGKNQDPASKIGAFAEYINKGLGGTADVAFFKFCYIDITPETEVEKIFAEYKNTLSDLKAAYPETQFVHITVPIKVVQTGPRAWIKKIIGRPIGGHAGNIKRNEFNDLVRKEYTGKEPVFDLAMVESTDPNGSRNLFKVNSNAYRALVPEYSHDGRHLNETGRKKVAEQLLIFLADL